MGWTVLYIAFGVVALWLLGEVLLQYKARLRWRLLAFAGFLGVVLGVLIPSVLVIGLGAIAFAIGQTYVTLSFRRGFAEGWAVNASLLSAAKGEREDRGGQDPAREVAGPQDPAGESVDEGAGWRRDQGSYEADDHDDVFTPVRGEREEAAETTAVYEMRPVPDDTGSYGVYNDNAYGTPARDDRYAASPQDEYGTPARDDQYAASARGTDQGYETGQNYVYDYSGYGQQQAYDTGPQQQYAAYPDPYAASATHERSSYDAQYTDPQQYGQQGYDGQDQYGSGYGGETPAGGLWVPQQRGTDDGYGGELPQEQPYPYQDNGGQGQTSGNGYDEQQYRY